jgi:signal transduction histidine kinase
LDEASGELRAEYFWILASMGITTLLLLGAGALLLRISLREHSLREAEKYRLKQLEMEKRLQLSERLGALGLLTAGVAHEINNPLEGIENYLTLLEKERLPEEKRKRYVELARYGFHRIRDIVRDLSTFARPAVSSGSASLGTVVENALKMVRYAKEFKNVAVSVTGFDPPLIISGDAGRLEQVFINLFINAAKAMKGTGRIDVKAKLIEVTDSAGEVEIRVEDSGPGISENDLGKIFDPFFTTGDGTGLGLSISFSIVNAHGGTLSAANRPEGGAAFVMRLPASQQGAKESEKVRARAS